MTKDTVKIKKILSNITSIPHSLIDIEKIKILKKNAIFTNT